MGVIRLWTYIKRHRSSCMEQVDLVELAAKHPEGIKILVDFYCWEAIIKDNFKASLQLKTNNPYLVLCGGEYKMITDYITSFIEALRSVNIEMLFFMDGAKGSSEFGTERKWDTWMERQKEDVRSVEQQLKILNREMRFTDLKDRELTRPCLQEVQNILTLQKLGCKIFALVSGEADTYIAQHMLENENCVAVLTNDTDFCIFPESVLLSGQFFDTGNDLELVNESMTIKSPKKLICGLFKSELLWRHFGFPNIQGLCELAILIGNDFTLPILDKARSYKSVRVPDYAGTIRQCGVVENCPFFAEIMDRDPRLVQAVQHSRAFYSITLLDDINVDGNSMMTVIEDGIKEGQYPSSVYAMHKSFYWHRMILEDCCQSGNTAERALVYLRSHIYSILLMPEQQTVQEYGRTPDQHFERMTAMKVLRTPIPSLIEVKNNSFLKNQMLFHKIMSHQDIRIPLFNKGYFKLYGNRLGFICYLLRYFLLLNWQQNLYVTHEEFLLLCVWLLGFHDLDAYVQVKILPSVRCVTIENWILLLFRTTYAFLGGLLNLTKEFPSPADLFSGAVWVNLYTASTLSPEHHFRTASHQEIPLPHLRFVNSEVKKSLQERKHVIENIVSGLFDITF